jgi:hypothetical protein
VDSKERYCTPLSLDFISQFMQANKNKFPADKRIFYEQSQSTEWWGYVQRFQIPLKEHFCLTATFLLTVSAFVKSDSVIRNTSVFLFHVGQSIYEISVLSLIRWIYSRNNYNQIAVLPNVYRIPAHTSNITLDFEMWGFKCPIIKTTLLIFV